MQVDFDKVKAEVKQYSQDVMAAAQDPDNFYQGRYNQLSEKTIGIAFAALTALSGMVWAFKFGGVETIVTRPITMGIGLAIWSAIVMVVGSAFFNVKREFREIAVMMAFVTTAYMPVAIATQAVFSPFSAMPTLLTMVCSFYLFYGGAKYRLGFSGQQVLILLIVPAIGALISLSTLAVLSPFSNFVENYRVESPSIIREAKASAKHSVKSSDVPPLRGGERYVYHVQASTAQGSGRGKLVAQVSSASDGLVRLSLNGHVGGEKIQRSFLIEPRKGGVTLFDFIDLKDQNGHSSHSTVQEVVSAFQTGQTKLLDAGVAFTRAMAAFVPKHKLKEAGIDLSSKKVRIAGRVGVQQTMQPGGGDTGFVISRDNRLSLPMLEYKMDDQKNGKAVHIRLAGFNG